MKKLDEITGTIVDAAMQIHRQLGPGLLESVYEVVLAQSLRKRGLCVDRQHPVAFGYDGLTFEEGFRVDLLVERQVVVELKSVERLAPVHGKQLLTYLRLMNLHVGLLINFNPDYPHTSADFSLLPPGEGGAKRRMRVRHCAFRAHFRSVAARKRRTLSRPLWGTLSRGERGRARLSDRDNQDFNSAYLKDGLHRVVNNLSPSASPRLRVNRMQLP